MVARNAHRAGGLTGRLLAALAVLAAAAVPVSAAGAAVEDDPLQIAVDRLHSEAGEFFRSDYHSITVVPLDDGLARSAGGGARHVSLSAAKAIWVTVAVAAAGADAVAPYAPAVFAASSNAQASRVISLVGEHPHEGVNAVNRAMWDWGMADSYLYAWFDHSGTSYGWHVSSVWEPAFPGSEGAEVWSANNFVTTDDLAMFWTRLGRGELLDGQDTDRVLAWAALPRDQYSDELIVNRLPSAVAAGAAHKSGLNYGRTRRIAGGLVTTASGRRYAVAIAFRTLYSPDFWGGGLDWARYASCEIYNAVEGTHHECTRSGDPASIREHAAIPVGRLASAAGERDQLRVSGWAFDPDAGADAITVRIAVDGEPVGSLTAGLRKGWIHERYGTGRYHGFAGTLDLDLSPGGHEVCAVGVNDGAGPDRAWCRTVEISPDHPPRGSLKAVDVEVGRLVAHGTAADADTAGPVKVKVFLDGERIRKDTADRGGTGRRFTSPARLPLTPGEHEVCAVALNHEHAGPNRGIGCITVEVPDNWPPQGRLARVIPEPGGLFVRGLAWDPESSDPVTVRIEIDGAHAASLPADRGSSGRKYGAILAHPGPGLHEVCALVTDPADPEMESRLGCETIVAAAAP
jgi:hypothetical protein